MKLAIEYAERFAAGHNQGITFVGHSKGGGEEIAIATNNDCIAFNPAKTNLNV